MRYRTQILPDAEVISRLNNYIENLDGTLRPLPQITVFFGRKVTPNEQTEGPIQLEIQNLVNSELAQSQLYSIERLILNLRPQGQGNNNRDVEVRFDNKLTHFEVSLIFNNHQVAEAKDIIDIAGPLQSSFPRAEFSPVVDGKVEELLTDLQHARDSISAKTELAIADLTAAIAETHKQSTERIDELSRNREAHYETLQEKHREKITADENRIKAQEKALSEREASLNLKEPIGERRKIHEELRGKLLEQIQEFGPSRAVVKSRWSVRLANWVIIGGALGAFIYFARSGDPAAADTTSNLALYFYLKLAASAALFFGFGAAYVRWEIRWLDKLADTEFQLRDKAIDVERSAWLVETVEALKSGNVDLPDGFLQLLGNNLFEPRESTESETENLSKFLQQLIGKKGELEAHMPGGGSVKINAEGSKGK